MKKLVLGLVTLSAMLFAQLASAQVHMGLGVTVGTDGVGPELGLSIGKSVIIRGGYAYMPGFSYAKEFDVDSDSPKIQGPVWVVGKLNMSSGKFLVDFYPGESGFHITAGSYFASPDLILATGAGDKALTQPIPTAESNWGTTSVTGGSDELGYVKAAIKDNGQIDASVRCNIARPYLGIGFGRLIKPESRVGFSFDLGAMYLGSLVVSGVDHRGERTSLPPSSALAENKDGGILDIVAKIPPVYPVLKFNVFVRLF